MLVAGSDVVSMSADGSSTSGIAVARFTSTGHADTQFGKGGAVSAALGSGNSWANGVAVDPWGRSVVAGHIESTGSYGFGVARLTSSGALDSTFAAGQGYVSTQFGVGSEAASVSTLPDGRILAAGANGRWGIGIACFHAPDGAPYPCNGESLLLARYWP
jgi:uncharacterized delta-60 repeat protein